MEPRRIHKQIRPQRPSGGTLPSTSGSQVGSELHVERSVWRVRGRRRQVLVCHGVVRDVSRSEKSPRPNPFGWRRLTGLGILTGVAAGAVAYMQVTVPLAGPSLARSDVSQYWLVAMLAGVVVLIATSAVVWLVLSASRKENE